MTVKWSQYAQSITEKPMKGMLTGPVTILNWSFPRNDVSRELQARQLALALRDEVLNLEEAKISAIQVDEPAIREGVSVTTRSRYPALVLSSSCLSAVPIGMSICNGLLTASSLRLLVSRTTLRPILIFATQISGTSSRPFNAWMPMSFLLNSPRAI